MSTSSASTGLRRAKSGVGAAGSGRPEKAKSKTLLSRGAITMMVLVAPSVILLVLINAYPLIYAFNQSLHKGTLIITGKFIGFENYVDVLTRPSFWKAARFTLIFSIVGVFGSWLIGL